MYSISKENPFKQIISFLIIMLISSLIFIGLSFLTAYLIWGSETMKNLGDFSNPDVIATLKYIQGWSHIGIFTIQPMVFALLSGHGILGYLNGKKIPDVQHFLMALGLIIIILPIIGKLAEWNLAMRLPHWLSGIELWMKESEEAAKIATEAIVKTSTISGLSANLLIMAILPAIGEEFLFRGFLMRYFSSFVKNIHLNIIIVSIIFSALHLQFYGFLPRMALGILLGYLFYWSGSIWLPIVVHFANNAMTVIVYYLAEVGKINIDAEDFGNINNNYLLIINIIILGLGFYWFEKHKDNANIFER